MSSLSTRSSIALVVTSVLVACGGASPSDLFDSAGSSQFGTDPVSTDGGNGSSNGGSSGNNNGSGNSGGNSGGGGSGNSNNGTDAGNGNGGGNTNDAGPMTTDAGPSGDNNPGSTIGPGIYCGYNSSNEALFCKPSDQQCCGTKDSTGLNMQFVCEAQGGACAGVPIHCSDKSACSANQICCGVFDQTKGYTSVECRAASACVTSGTTTGIRMCDPTAQVDECQSIGATCTPSQSLTGFDYCAN